MTDHSDGRQIGSVNQQLTCQLSMLVNVGLGDLPRNLWSSVRAMICVFVAFYLCRM